MHSGGNGDNPQSEAFNATNDQACHFPLSWNPVFQPTAAKDSLDVEDREIEDQLLRDMNADEKIDGVDQLLDEQYEQRLWKEYAPWSKVEQHDHAESGQAAPMDDPDLQVELDRMDAEL